MKSRARYGIPKKEDFKDEVTITADGTMKAQYNGKYSKEEGIIVIPFENVNEIMIIVSRNAKL